MYARVAKWEGGDADALRAAAKDINDRSGEGPPPGVPAKRFLMLIDPEGGRSLAIVLFETKEDLEQGHATLEGMTPQQTGTGERVSVEQYEVGVDVGVD
jgi:hypothetical protein